MPKTIIFAMNAKPMEMEIAPIEGDLQRVMEIGDGAGLCDQQAPPDQRADLAQHHPQLIDHTWLRISAHAARFLRCRRGQPTPRPARYAVRGRSGKVRYKSSRYSNTGMAKQAGQSTQTVGIGGQIAGGKRMAQSVRGIVDRWIGKQQVAGHGPLKKRLRATKRRLIVAGAAGSTRCWA